MKGVIEYNLPEDQTAFELSQKVESLPTTFLEIINEIFRPARKYGYNDPILANFLNDLTEEQKEKVEDFVYLLEKKFHEIVSKNGFYDYY